MNIEQKEVADAAEEKEALESIEQEDEEYIPSREYTISVHESLEQRLERLFEMCKRSPAHHIEDLEQHMVDFLDDGVDVWIDSIAKLLNDRGLMPK